MFGIFTIKSDNIFCHATRDVAHQSVTISLLNSYSSGNYKLENFIKAKLCYRTIKFHDRLKQTKSPTLKTMYQVQAKSVSDLKQKNVKADRALFQRLLVAKEGQQLSPYELSTVPLSLADTAGKLRLTNKAILGLIIESNCCTTNLPPTASTTATIIDGQALICAIDKPAALKTFGDLSETFTGAVGLFSHLNQSCSCVDAVFDRYYTHSIKDATRDGRAGTTKLIRLQIHNSILHHQ